jgi:hypothetical protein
VIGALCPVAHQTKNPQPEIRVMNDPIIVDCTGFNFYCQEGRTYVIFDPQSQDEYDRLDKLLGGSELLENAFREKAGQFPDTDRPRVQPFTELKPVGFVASSENETVAVILAGAIGKLNDEFQANGDWFAVRFREDALVELKNDLRTELEQRKQKLLSGVYGRGLKISEIKSEEEPEQ